MKRLVAGRRWPFVLIILSESSGPERRSCVKGNTVLEGNGCGEEFTGSAKVIPVENSGKVIAIGVACTGRLSEEFVSTFVASTTGRFTIQIVKRTRAIFRGVPRTTHPSGLVENRKHLHVSTLPRVSRVVVAVGHGNGFSGGTFNAVRVGVDIGSTVGAAGHVVDVALERGGQPQLQAFTTTGLPRVAPVSTDFRIGWLRS
jgi:hypothetical protein